MTNSTIAFSPTQLLGVPLFSDWIGLAGLVVSIVGFGFTLFAVMRSKTIAEQAKLAADSAIAKLRGVNAVADLSSIVAKLEEVKRIHRLKGWLVLPDRYSELRNIITSIRNSNVELTDIEQAMLQQAVLQLVKMEKEVEKEIQKEKPDDSKFVKFNEILTSLTDVMYEIVCKSKNRIGG